MKVSQTAFATLFCTLLGASLAFAQDKGDAAKTSPAPAAGGDDTGQMMALTQPGENHKVLAYQVGSWKYNLKFWMIPGAPPTESSGTSVCKPAMGGRYFLTESAGKFQMPGPDGKMQDVEFKGMSTDAYDNVKKKFVSTWIDNMGTGILMSEGTYDPASKTFTYLAEEEPTPGVKTKMRETVKIIDQDHYVMDWYEDHGGQEVKTMELSSTRQG